MHHVRRVKDLKSKAREKKMDFFTMQMAAINRKQVPLCGRHHKALHNNTLTEAERALFKNNLKLLKQSSPSFNRFFFIYLAFTRRAQ